MAFSAMIRHVSDAVPKGAPLTWHTGLREGSLQVVAKPVSVDAHAVEVASKAIVNGVRGIASGSDRPHFFDDEALKCARKLANLRRDGTASGISSVSIIHREHAETLGTEVVDHVNIALERVEHSHGSIEGVLRMVSTVKGLRCSLYERLHDRRVDCNFPNALWHEVFVAAEEERRVEATGRIRYSDDGLPKYINVKDLYVFPAVAELPSHMDVLGILRDDWIPPDERR